ncbi:purple acid phosphatase family protein [Sporomusa termitida]|uniref:Uncharacterized protein n=1 Tax=Sporomusa termitida TaxID=2377 RepID=A0A517DY53_9FIRM|nr:metallophosphoesterase family protein [Sporomusa termitida]QDR82289.1 hypothetical protein SPTER_37140 [Sporomusa termitida]
MRKPLIFVQILCLIAVILLSSTALLSAAIMPAPNAWPDHITLTWTDDPATTQTITWRTGAATVGGQAEYAEAADFIAFPAGARAAAGIEVLRTNTGDMAIHSVTLTGLKPGTRYLYRVGTPDHWSEPHAFTTAGAQVPGFKFLVFGDSQSINYGVWQTTLRQAFQANRDAVFFTNVGDLVDVGQDYTHWAGWFSAARGVIDTIPAMPVAGNHECYTPARQFSKPVFFTAQFKLPQNGPAGLKGQVYSFDYGDVHFIMLDSQAGEQRQFEPDMLHKQSRWLQRDLMLTDKKWKIAFIHRPLYNNKPNPENPSLRQVFGPIFDQYHVDLVFTGHDHVYARTYPLYGGAAAGSPAGGTIYVASGRSGTKTYLNTAAKEWNRFFHNPVAAATYITVETGGHWLRVNAFSHSGLLIDAWEINK